MNGRPTSVPARPTTRPARRCRGHPRSAIEAAGSIGFLRIAILDRMKSSAIVCLSFLLVAGCASHRKPVTPESNIITFDMLSPEMQARGRALYGPRVDKEWQRIVDATIKAQP